MHRVFRDPLLQERFERDGYVVVDFLDDSEICRLLEIWESLPSDLGAAPFSNTIMSRDLEYRQKVNERVLEVIREATDALLDHYRLCLCGFNAKLPQHAGGVVQLHQDSTLVDESRYQPIGIWCPLTEVSEENGCLRVVPGSYRLNRRPRDFLGFFPYTELLPCLERDYLVDIPMKAGQAFVYALTLFHSSPPNRSDRLRLVAAALAIPDQSKLRFLMRDAQEDRQLAVYEVADDFYRSYVVGSQPDESLRIGSVKEECEPLTEERLREILGNRDASGSI